VSLRIGSAYPRAIRTELGEHVRHRTSRYLNNRLEQDHRGIKDRCRPMLGLNAHSGDHERSIRSIMNTEPGDHEHALAVILKYLDERRAASVGRCH
jgi:transposase-like protein